MGLLCYSFTKMAYFSPSKNVFSVSKNRYFDFSFLRTSNIKYTKYRRMIFFFFNFQFTFLDNGLETERNRNFRRLYKPAHV